MLRVHEGDLSVTTPGTVIDGLDIHGFLKINAANVTVKNSIIRGGTTSVGTSLVQSRQPGFTITDSELVPSTPNWNINGLQGYGFTAKRLDIHGAVDGVVIWGDDTTLEASWLHGNTHYADDPNWGGDDSHDDSIQVQAGNNIRLTGNTYSDAYNSGLQVTQDVDLVSNLTFTGNWAGGGGCTVNISEKGRGAIRGLTISDNRFGHDTRVDDCAVIMPSTTGALLTAVNNVWADNGLPVRIRTNG